jgi:hypothetical protein
MAVLGQMSLGTTALGETEAVGFQMVLEDTVAFCDVVAKMPIRIFSETLVLSGCKWSLLLER